MRALIFNKHVSLRYGWVASTNPDFDQIESRGPSLEPPKDLLVPMREQRTVVFANFPDLPNSGFRVYRLLHNFNVIWVDSHDLNKNTKGLDFYVQFATRGEAERAKQQYDGFPLEGRRLDVHTWQTPRKYLGSSWGSGRGGVHYSGRRDQGSAVGTNFEEVRRSVEVSCCVSGLIEI